MEKKRTWIIWLVLTVVVVILAAGGVWLASNNKLAITLAGHKRVVTKSVICDNDVITKYNDAVMKPHESFAEYIAQLEGVSKEVEAKANYDTDPNCLFIVYQYYVLQTDPDTEKLRGIWNKLSEINENGVYLDGNIINPDSLRRMDDKLRTIENGPDEGADGIGVISSADLA